MAQGYYEKLYKSLKSSNKVNKTPLQDANSRVNNLETRLKAGGVDVDKATDNRNFIEKALNLTPDQNFLFDIFEVLGRPQQAIFGGIENSQQGKDFWEGAGQGLTGKKETQFKQILQNSSENSGGMLNNMGVKFNDRKGKVDLIDVLGFVGDVMLDPTDLALIPVTGGSNLAADVAVKSGAKGLKVADNISDIAKAGKGISLVQDASKGVKTVDNATDLVKMLDTMKDASDIATKTTKKVSLSELIFSGAGKAVKGAAKLTDTGIEKVLKNLDEVKGVENVAGEVAKLKYANPSSKMASGLGSSIKDMVKFNPNTKTWEIISEMTAGVPKGRLEAYKEIKNWFTRAFNNAASIPKGVMDTLRKSNADTSRAARELSVIRQGIDNSLNDAAKALVRGTADDTAEGISKVAKRLDGEVLDLKEYLASANRTDTVRNVIKLADKGTLPYTEEIANKLRTIADDVNLADRGLKLDIIKDGNRLKLSKDWNVVLENMNLKKGTKASKGFEKLYQGVTLDNNLLDEVINLPSNYTAEQIQKLEQLKQAYQSNPTLKALYEQLDPVFDKANEIIDKNFGTGLATKYTDNAGYVRHAYDDNMKELKRLGLINEDGTFKLGGNTKVLGDRKYKMSVMEANNLFEEMITKNYKSLDDEAKAFVDGHKTLFKQLYSESFDDYLKNIPRIAKDNKLIDDILVKQTFGDWQEAEKVRKSLKQATKKGDKKLVEKLTKQYSTMLEDVNMKVLSDADQLVPAGFKRLAKNETDQVALKMNKIADELGVDSMRDMASFVKKQGSALAINQDILRFIDINLDKKTAPALVRMYDSALNMFKRNKVLSPTFQMNNLFGNTSNMALGGITVTKQAQLFPQAIEILGKNEELLTKAAQGVELTAKEARQLKIYNAFLDAGFGNPKQIMDLRDMPDSLKKYFTGEKQFRNVKDIVVDGLPYLNNKMNNYMDNTARLATFIEAFENPKFLTNLGVDNAGDAVRKILFDPSDLTDFEKKVMKRIIPFYTFTKKNLAYHISNLGENGRRYHRLMKGYKEMNDNITGGNYDTMADYLKENLYIPFPALGKDGEYKMLRSNLPFGQLLDMVSNPLQSIVSSTGPMPRSLYELASGVNTFTGRPIEKFAGEDSKNIPGLSKMQEYMLGQTTGLDTPLTQLSRFAEGLGQDGNLIDRIGQGIGGVTTTDYNVETDKLYATYDKLDELETLMKQYKQQGYEFSTINELKKANRNTKVETIMSRLNKMNGVKENPYSVIK